MTTAVASRWTALRWRLAMPIARFSAAAGVPGWAGIALMAAAMVVASAAWRLDQHDREPLAASGDSEDLADAASGPVPAAPARHRPPDLPHSTQAVALLRQFNDSAKASGLTWPRADYRSAPLTDDQLASLAISTTFKGPYPNIRRLVTRMLDEQPALALRELSISRPNSDVAEVEAKITWAVFLSDGWADSLLAQGVRP